MLVEVVDDDSNEEVEGEKGAEDDEEDEVEVHVDVHLTDRLLPNLMYNKQTQLKEHVWFILLS